MTKTPPGQYDEQLQILQTSRDRDELERAASQLAATGKASPSYILMMFLRSPEFLARLDDVKDASQNTKHISGVLKALQTHPSVNTERLCLALADNSDFRAIDDRMIYLLPALAAVRPMSEKTAALFREENDAGYFSANAIHLAENASPRALELFASMMRTKSVDPESRASDIHASLLPKRTDLAVLKTIESLLDSDVEASVAVALIETVFDEQSVKWFGKTRQPPQPPPWKGASPEALKEVAALGGKVRNRPGLSPELVKAIDATTLEVRGLLESH